MCTPSYIVLVASNKWNRKKKKNITLHTADTGCSKQDAAARHSCWFCCYQCTTLHTCALTFVSALIFPHLPNRLLLLLWKLSATNALPVLANCTTLMALMCNPHRPLLNCGYWHWLTVIDSKIYSKLIPILQVAFTCSKHFCCTHALQDLFTSHCGTERQGAPYPQAHAHTHCPLSWAWARKPLHSVLLVLFQEGQTPMV